MLSTLGRRRALYRGRNYRAYSGGEVRTVTFPTSQLTTRVHIALGADLTASYLTWNWLDITEYVRHDLGITVDFGRRNESTRVNPSRCQLKLDNAAGRFSRRNPHGPWYGLLGGKVPNVPIWIQRDAGDGFVDAYFGFINEAPVRWTDPSGSDSYVVVQCSGVLRRLAQGENVDTTLNKTILGDGPVHYWRLDDQDGSAQAASSLPTSGTPMYIFAGPPGWRQAESPPGGDGDTSAPTVSGQTFFAADNLGVEPPWTWSALVKRPTDGSADGAEAVLCLFNVSGVEQSGSDIMAEDTANPDFEWYHYMFVATQEGANARVQLYRNGIDQGAVFFSAGTLQDLVFIRLGLTSVETAVAYSTIFPHADADPVVHSDAVQAFAGEQAHRRMARVAAEAGIPFACQAAESAELGPQPSGTVLDILRDAENTDGGVLYEDKFGLGYQALSERYNAPVVFELDFDQWHIYAVPELDDSDQRFRNQWTLRSATTGAARTARDPDYSVVDGLYDDGDTINPASDDQLLPAAGWRVRRDTVDEDRWPRLPINLGGTPELIPGWNATPFGARVTASNPPAEVSPATIDAILEGYTEHWDTVSWVANLNVSPASIYQVGVAGDSTTRGAWAQTSNAVLAEDVDDAETSIDVTSTDTWTTSPGGELIRFGGEVVSLDAVSGSAPNWVFTVTRSVNSVVKSHSAGASVRVHRPAVAAY